MHMKCLVKGSKGLIVNNKIMEGYSITGSYPSIFIFCYLSFLNSYRFSFIVKITCINVGIGFLMQLDVML